MGGQSESRSASARAYRPSGPLRDDMVSIPWGMILWTLLSGLLVASLDPDSAAPSCADVLRGLQFHPTLRQYDFVPDAEEFIKQETGPRGQRPSVNNVIPPWCKQSVRAVLYNVRGFTALHPSIDMATSFEKDLRDMNATVLALQEIPLVDDKANDGSGEKRKQLERILSSLGYEHRLEAADPTWPVMLASRVPLVRTPMRGVSGQWVAGRVKLGHGNDDVILVNVRFRSATTDPGEATRGILAVQDINLEGASGEREIAFYTYELHPVHRLFASHFFRKARWPPYTSWLCLVLHEIVASRSLKDLICGAYTFHTPTTGHLPQIVDLGKCSKGVKPLLKFMLGGLAIILVLGLGAYYYRVNRRHQVGQV